jgi:DNA-binding NarL/FixJ family response regulator
MVQPILGWLRRAMKPEGDPADTSNHRVPIPVKTLDHPHSPTVVLVEDDEINRRLLATLLALDDITVLGESGTAQGGIDLALAYRPDVVLMDLHLPDMSGIEATRRITTAAWPTQVVVLTAYGGGLPTRGAYLAGAFTYLNKGSSSGVVTGAIRRASAVKRALSLRAPGRRSRPNTAG